MKQLGRKVFYSFSIKNYSKRLDGLAFTRHHNRIRYDENYQLQTNKYKLNDLIQKENDIFKQVDNDLKQNFEKYFDVSMQRKDSRFQELPERCGNYYYYTKNGFMGSNNNNYEIIFRQNIQTGIDECILDLADISILKQYQNTARFAKLCQSDDHQMIAFGVDLESNEHLQFYIKDLKKNIILQDQLQYVKNIVFNKDGKSLFYVKHDGRHWTNQVYYHRIGTNQNSDELLYEEKDESYYLDIATSQDKKYLIINSSSKQNSEVRVVERTNGYIEDEDIKVIFSRERQNRAYANHAGDKFYILTDADGVYDFKIVTLDDQELLKQDDKYFQFQDFYVPQNGEVLSEIDLFKNNIVLYQKKDGEMYLTNIEISSKIENKIQLKDKFAIISPGLNENFETDTFRFHVDTPFSYNKIYEYNFQTKQVNLLEDSQLEGPKFDQDKFTVTRTYAPSKDGETIPITLVHKKNIQKNRANKVLLHGYGHYGLSMDSEFGIVYLKALEEDWIMAYAHVRGGNEQGWNWHKQAIKENKPVSYKDFISCAEYLVSDGYTHPSLLCAFGSSAGGTLVGSVINMRPDLFKAVVLHFPFLDVLTTLLDRNLELTQTDHDEFGDPINNKQIYDIISSYCPYENIVQDTEYPSVLIVCGSDDYRSPLWNVLKYVNRFRTKTVQDISKVDKFCDNNLAVNIVNSGHFGESSVESSIAEKAQQMAFLDYVVMDKNQEIAYK